jgi:Xaa-Pro dipeptidase
VDNEGAVLNQDLSRSRQQRLLTFLSDHGIGVAVLVSPRSVTYFTGVVPDERFPHAFILRCDGSSDLIGPNVQITPAVDRHHAYERYSLQRSLTVANIFANAVATLKSALRDCPAPRTLGIESEYLSHGFILAIRGQFPDSELVSLTGALLCMRRNKSADEVARIRQTGELLSGGYRAVRERLAIGMTETDVYNIFWTAAVELAQSPVQPAGDFACGLRGPEGGGPTERRVQDGDLFIIDAFPRFGGYHADLCRTFAVAPPSQLQREAWAVVAGALELAEHLIRPGAQTARIYEAIRSHLNQFAPAVDSFRHHAGHGIGLDPQELPWLIPGSDEVLCEGDVVAVEPGLYSPALQGGLRLEQNYLVTGSGCELLSGFPLEII